MSDEHRDSTYQNPVSLNLVPRELSMHSVTEEELSTLRAVGPTTAVGMLGITVGASVAFYTALQATGLSHDARTNLNALYFAARVLSVFFVIVAVWGYVRLAFVVRRIKKRPSGPAVVRIVKAMWGSDDGRLVDVVDILEQELRTHGHINRQVMFTWLGDPAEGVLKYLDAEWTVGTVSHKRRLPEGADLVIP